MMRLQQPFANHNGGHLTFHPLASPGDREFGLLYVGVADGGSGGDPLHLAQNLGSIFGKILRIDPLGSTSANGKYGIPRDNPFVGRQGVLSEIYAYGVRNPQRFGWDPKNGNLFVADIGQNVVEELSPVTPGADLGWNAWEGSFPFISREGVELSNQRGDAGVTYPVVEYAQPDPLFQAQVAITGVYVYRGSAIPQLTNRLLFGDFPSGEIFYISADDLPKGGQDPIRRVLLAQDGGQPKTLLRLIQEKNAAQGKPAATRADLRFDEGPDAQILLLNKHDGTIRRVVPSPVSR
jgi:glucose/arabinose dehydrogenase